MFYGVNPFCIGSFQLKNKTEVKTIRFSYNLNEQDACEIYSDFNVFSCAPEIPKETTSMLLIAVSPRTPYDMRL